MAYNRLPMATINLDSARGFEDLGLIPNISGLASLNAKIITETKGFLYVSPGITKEQGKLLVRAIPLSRIQSFQYSIVAEPFGK